MSTPANGTHRYGLRSFTIAGSVLASAAFACSAADDGDDLFSRGAGADAAPMLPSGSPGAASGFEDFGDVSSGGPGGPSGSGCPTSVSGVTRDPAGQLPLYNVVVSVPSEPLAPIPRGARCETCDGDFSGRPRTMDSKCYAPARDLRVNEGPYPPCRRLESEGALQELG